MYFYLKVRTYLHIGIWIEKADLNKIEKFALELPELPEFLELPELPDLPELPELPEFPELPDPSEFPELPELSTELIFMKYYPIF